jgi:hypothetical protein
MSLAAGSSNDQVEAARVKPEDLESNIVTTTVETESSQPTANSGGKPKRHQNDQVEAAPVKHEDLESNIGTTTTVETESSQPAANSGGKPKRQQRKCCGIALCAGCFLVLTVAIVLFVVLGCMNDPTWEVVETNIDPLSLTAMIIAVGTGSSTTSTLSLTNTVRIHNPNFIGAFVEPEVAHVTYHNQEFATSQLDSFTLKRRGVTTLTAPVSVHLSPSLAPLIVQDVINNAGTIMVHAVSDATATVGIFKVRTRIDCKIWADMMATIGDHPENSIKKKECVYYKGL